MTAGLWAGVSSASTVFRIIFFFVVDFFYVHLIFRFIIIFFSIRKFIFVDSNREICYLYAHVIARIN